MKPAPAIVLLTLLNDRAAAVAATMLIVPSSATATPCRRRMSTTAPEIASVANGAAQPRSGAIGDAAGKLKEPPMKPEREC